MRRAASCRLIPLLLLALLVPVFGRSAEAQQRHFGINAFGHGSNFPDFGAAAQLQQDLGVQWSRVGLGWGQIQPTSGDDVPSFATTDPLVYSLTSRGVEVVGLLGGTPKWASPSPGDPFYFQYPPLSLDDWEEYVRALVGHYQDDIEYWEVWNQPNYELGWRPAPDIDGYFAMLQRTWDAIKDVDPTAQVVLGGIAGIDLNWLKGLVDRGAWNIIDVLAVHPYDGFATPENFGRIDNLKRLRAYVAELGAKPIWYTEVAWPAQPYVGTTLTQADQADYLIRDYVQSIWLRTDRYAWWNLREDGVDPSFLFFHTGLYELDMTPKPASAAFDAMTSAIGDMPFRQRRLPYAQTLITSFDAIEPWAPGTWGGGATTFGRNGTQSVSGAFSGGWTYSFPPGSGAVAFVAHEIPLAGTPRRFSLWVKPDNGDHRLSIEFIDAGGEVFRLKMGFTIGTEWQHMTADVVDATSPMGGDGVINYPIRFSRFYLQNFQIPVFPFFGKPAGTIYLEEFTYDGGAPHVHDYQFGSAGAYVDVIWTTDPGPVRAVPFPAATVMVTDASGSSSTVNDGGPGDIDGTANRITTLGATDSPMFVSWEGTSAYVLDAFGRIHPGAAAIGDMFDTPFFGFDVAVDFEFLNDDTDAYYLLDGYGGIHAGNGAPPAIGAPYFGFHIGRDIEIAPGGTGVYLLDGFGGIHRAGGAPALPGPPTPYFGFDVARDLEFAAVGYYVADGFGGVHRGGGAPAMNPKTPYFGFDVVADLELTTVGYYVLDGFGGVHRGGGAPAMNPPTPYFGFDVAVDIELGDLGYYVLDAFGGVHRGGGAPGLAPVTKYFGTNSARDLEIR